ncbi:MAG TPA: type IV pilus assembly protein PilM [Candidatus Saccharimonadales bacterium]|nr:type IV pilus assembly protein PilM [Candidatus Saccharimonadales bacterium]
MNMTKSAAFFHDKPLFGLEIGHGSMKVMQVGANLSPASAKSAPAARRLIGYGATTFDTASQKDGVIVQPEIVAKAALELFRNRLVGDITTRRVAIAIPAYRTFTRSLRLPKLKPKELSEAVQLEAEQYIPLPLEELYLDYDVIGQIGDSMELFAVATPRNIVDSYLDLAQILGLETVLIEPTLSSLGRLFSLDSQHDIPAIIINLGSVSSDISIFDGRILITGTVQGGGEDFTRSIKEKLDVSLQEAALIKTRYGLGVSKKQVAIKEALEPILQEIVKEIRRMVRYYSERYGLKRPIEQVVTLGGGANMPGLDEYLTETLHLAVRHSEPWQYLDFKGLQPPGVSDRPMYSTAAGLSLARPHEVFGND